ncbi:GntR family transcriptional regulator [Nocardia amamiensis]|uniref:GntR family transcriptional regulator n=2 Tax=Nocardia amamiensis TaxID=404578 RepID=A0ABS0CQ75_9NOCA|nr:GntR family transcriptional regulator [Nocardia amamiensis]
MMAEIDDELPKYLQISAHLRELIERGELAPGAEVPSERELAAQWKVARPTAAKALNTLRQQGIVRSRRGSGTYVTDRRALMRENAPRYGPPFAEDDSVTVLEAAVVTAPREVADELGPSCVRAVMRKELSINTHGSVTLTTSWYPHEFAESTAGLLTRERLPGRGLRYLESAVGRGTAVVRERIGARLATGDERRHLALSSPAAVLVVHRTCLDADGRALEFCAAVHPPGRWILQQEYSTSSAADFRR